MIQMLWDLTCHRQHLQRSHDAQMLKSKIPKLWTPPQEQGAQWDHRGDVTDANIRDVYTPAKLCDTWMRYRKSRRACQKHKIADKTRRFNVRAVRRLAKSNCDSSTTFWHFVTRESAALRNAWSQIERLSKYFSLSNGKILRGDLSTATRFL